MAFAYSPALRLAAVIRCPSCLMMLAVSQQILEEPVAELVAFDSVLLLFVF